MLVKISQHGHVIMPPFLLEAFGLGPGDTLELEETEDGFALKLAEKYVKPPPTPVDWSKYGTLRDKIKDDWPPLDINQFREAGYDPVKYRETFDYEEYRKNYCPDKYREWYEQNNNRD